MIIRRQLQQIKRWSKACEVIQQNKLFYFILFYFSPFCLDQASVQDRTGQAWTEDRIRVEARTEDRTDLGPVLGRKVAQVTRATSVFCGARSDRA